MSLLHTIKYWGLAGLLAPVAILIIDRLQNEGFAWPAVGLLLWPTWPLAIAAGSYAEPQPSSLVIYTALSIGLNIMVYSLVGLVVSKFYRS